MADSYDDYLADGDKGSGGAVATADDSYAEYLRQKRADAQNKKRADAKAPPAPATLPPALTSAQTANLSSIGITSAPLAPPTGGGLQEVARRMTLAPADVVRTRATPAAEPDPFASGEGLEARLSREAHESSTVGKIGQFAEDQAAGALGMAVHPLDAAGALAKRVVTAPTDIVRGVGNLGARALTSAAETMGVPLPKSSEDTPSYGESLGQIWGGILDTALLTEPAIGGASKIAKAGSRAAYTAAADESRFQSALERARSDAMAARARRSGVASDATRSAPLALPSGQYDMGPSTYETRGAPETDPSRLLAARATGAGVPTETGRTATAPIGMPAVDWESPLLQTKADAAAASSARQSARGLPRALLAPTVDEAEGAERASEVSAENRETRASPQEVDAYKVLRDAGVGPSGRKLGSPTPLPGETTDAFEQRVAARQGIVDTAAERSAIQEEGAAPADVETAARAEGKFSTATTKGGASRPISQFPQLTDDALHAHMADLIDNKLGEQRGAPNNANVARLNAAEAELESRGMSPEDIWTKGLEQGRSSIAARDVAKSREAGAADLRPLVVVAGAGAGAIADPDHPVQGAALGALSALGLVAVGTSLARDGAAIGTAESRAADARTLAAERAAPSRPPRQTARGLSVDEMMQRGQPLDIPESVDEWLDGPKAAPKDWRQVRADALGEAVKPEESLPVASTPATAAAEAPPAEVAGVEDSEVTPRTGAVDPRLVKTLGLAGAGAVVGGTQGSTPEERTRNAALGFALGGAGGAMLSREAKVLSAGEKAEIGAEASGAREKPTPRQAADAITATFSPASRGPLAGQTAQTVRAAKGQVDRQVATAQTTLDRISTDLRAEPIGKKLGFIDRIEGGVPQNTERAAANRGEVPKADLGAHQPVANSIRRTLDEERDRIIGLGKGKLANFNENYFPHLWQDPKAAESWLGKIMGKTPFEGSKSFLKQRTIPTVLEGMFPEGVPKNLESMSNAEVIAENKRQGGLVPVTFNPVEATMLKLREMKKYRMAQEVISDLDTRGLLTTMKEGERMPVGYARIGDWAFTNKVAPEPVARVLNNYFSPGLRGGPMKSALDAYMAVGNTLNQAQLGLSAFHAGMTTIEAMVSHNALSLEKLFQGKPGEALRRFATSGAGLLAPFENVKRGTELLAAYHAPPGTLSGPIADIADAAAEAGSRPKMEGFDKASKAFANARDAKQYGRMAKQFLPALLEKSTGRVLNDLVPRQKYGVFYDLMQSELEKLGPEASPDAVTRAAQKAWDSVDNRLGSLVYDNLFWDKTAKDVLHASVRSVGWNWGTFRELGGGTKDLAGMMKDLVTGKTPELSHRAAYTLALPMTVGVLGAITQYLYTGKGPETLQDYFQPRTGTKDADGNDNRVQLPTYMKDVISYGTHPMKTLTNKLNPLVGMLYDTWTDKNFYGDEIYNKDEPFMKELGQTAKYVGKESIPFFIQNLVEGKKRGMSPSAEALSFVGVTPASREAVRSKAQNAMADYSGRHQIERTPEEADAAKLRADLRDKVRTHGAAAAMEELRAHVRDGTLTVKQVQTILQDDKTPGIVRRFKGLPLADAERIYKLGTAREQQLWAPILSDKRQRASR